MNIDLKTNQRSTPDTMSVTEASGRHRLPGRLEVMISEEELQSRIREMARTLNEVYANTENLIIIGVLKGSFIFLADLVRHLTIPCQVEFVRLSSYENGTTTTGMVTALDMNIPDLTGEDVLLVEDIIDTGLTLHSFMQTLSEQYQPESMRLAVLLDKPAARCQAVPVDFTGFTIENEFVIGYGLDLAGFHRNLPYIGVVRQDADASEAE